MPFGQHASCPKKRDPFLDHTFVGHDFGFWPDLGLRTWEVVEYSRELHWLTLYGGVIKEVSGTIQIQSSNVPLPPRSYSVEMALYLEHLKRLTFFQGRV